MLCHRRRGSAGHRPRRGSAFIEALQRFGIPDEVLTDNGKPFTGRFTQPRPAEVMFERICRENRIVARNTKPRTPTTTGKVERFHQTLQRELLDQIPSVRDRLRASHDGSVYFPFFWGGTELCPLCDPNEPEN